MNQTIVPPKPFANCYWVEPGRLLAGEYPLAEQLEALLAARIHTFIDLTRPGEMPAYENLLLRSGVANRHRRFPIPDHGIPPTADVVTRALDAIDQALAEGLGVYVHCRAGIGRTGTLIACYWVRRGLSNEAALERLNELWRASERSRTWPQVPETPEQIAYALNWREAPAEAISPSAVVDNAIAGSTLDRCRGAFLGLAIGDALGALLPAGQRESSQRVEHLAAGGPLDLPQGAWTADTAMAVCIAESLLECDGVDLDDHLSRYLLWQREGKYSSTGTALGVPAEVERALATWQWSNKPLGSSHDPRKRDPHTLARTLPVVIYHLDRPARVIDQSVEASRSTLQSPLVLDACRLFGTLLLDALQGRSKDEMLSLETTPAALALRSRLLKSETVQLLQGRWRRLMPMPPGGDALTLIAATLKTLEQTQDFVSGLLAAINDSPIPTHAGAVFGSLAGAYYGLSGIPASWRGVVIDEPRLLDLAERLWKANGG